MKLWYMIIYCIVWPLFNLYHMTGVLGRKNLPNGGALICANHSANSDPIFVAFACGIKMHLHIMAKVELFKIPLIGFILRKSGMISISRGKSDIGAIKSAISYLKRNECVMLFPEGTRVNGHEDNAAKTGAAMLALKTGVPVVPVYVPKKKGFLHRVKVVIGEPYVMKCDGKPSPEVYQKLADELMDRIYALGEKKV